MVGLIVIAMTTHFDCPTCTDRTPHSLTRRAARIHWWLVKCARCGLRHYARIRGADAGR